MGYLTVANSQGAVFDALFLPLSAGPQLDEKSLGGFFCVQQFDTSPWLEWSLFLNECGDIQTWLIEPCSIHEKTAGGP